MIPLPNVAVLPSQIHKGVNRLSDDAEPLELLPFDEAFNRHYDTDAHFTTYTLLGTDERFPRCNKSVLPELQQAGSDLQTNMLVFDYDNHEHAAWTPATLAVFMEKLSMLGDDFPLSWQWSLFYTTRAGARFVYVLDRPVHVLDAEQHHAWIIGQFAQHDIELDKACSDWTRIFRLPFVTRNGKPTWQQADPPTEIMRQYDARLEVSTLDKSPVGYKKSRSSTSAPAAVPLNLPKPNFDDALRLIEAYGENGYAKTRWYSLAKRRLTGRDCYDCIFENQPLALKGGRNRTIIKYVGQAIAMLATVPGTTPAHIYALFLIPVSQLEPDADTPDWSDVLWSAILRIWSAEEAKAAGVCLPSEHSELTADAMLTTMARGMKQWCSHGVLDLIDSEDPEERAVWQEFVMRRLIVSSPKGGFSLLRSDGYYDPIELDRGQIIMRWRLLGMDLISPSRIPKENGKGFRDVTTDSLLNQHGFVVPEVEGRVGQTGIWVMNMDNGLTPKMVVPLFGRNTQLEAEAAFDPEVDQWLRTLFGDSYPDAEMWIQWALAFEEGPIAALSINGRAGVGKKLLVQGLAECLSHPYVATAADLVGTYQYGLLRSPFLVVNEGWPNTAHLGVTPADQFRHIVGGDPIKIERKFKAPVEIRNPARVIFTANNMNVISGLTGNRDLSPDDREALFLRILHFNVGGEASDWLSARGGLRFTGRPGRRWIASDSGEASDFVIAKHFLWLYLQRREPPGGVDRLLVQGGKNPEVLFDLRTTSGKAPVVIEALLKMIDSPSPIDGMAIRGTDIYVTGSGMLDWFRRHSMDFGKESLTQNQVSSVLKGMMMEEPQGGGFILPGREEQGRRRWIRLDKRLLQMVAVRDGRRCKRLEQLFSQEEESAKKAKEIAENARVEQAMEMRRYGHV